MLLPLKILMTHFFLLKTSGCLHFFDNVFSFFIYSNLILSRKWLLLFFLSAFFIGFSPYSWNRREVNGSRRWLDLGFMNMQPSEIAKIFVPIYLCGYCLRRKNSLKASGFLKPIVIISLISLLLFFEPDIGAMVVIFACVGILFIGGAKHAWEF